MKTIVLVHLRRCNVLLRQAPPTLPSYRSSVDSRADRLPPPPPPLGGKWPCSLKSEVRYPSPKPQSNSEPLISLTYRWSEGPSPQPLSVWNMLKQTGRAKAIKILPCAGLFLTRALWHDYKMLKVSTHLGIRTVLPCRWSWKNMLHILPVSGSPILASLSHHHPPNRHPTHLFRWDKNVWAVRALICV